MDHGHPDAAAYPLGMLMDEARLITQRVNVGHVTTATLLQSAVSGILSKRANKEFKKQIDRLLES